MIYQGVLKKMITEFGNPIQYYLLLESDFINVNQILNKNIRITFIKNQCLHCGADKPIYRQGYDKQCFFKLPQTAEWLIRPELSTAHLGKAYRDLEYEKEVQLQPHVVYLANSGHVKVGVTRKSQIPTRWIDQGAHKALEIVEVPNRYLAGITEVALKPYVVDKTNWRKMLKNDFEDVDLLEKKSTLIPYLPENVRAYVSKNTTEIELNFPVYKFPKKPKSLNLLKTVTFSQKLIGIKGQYLIFDDDTVFNIRNNEGLVIELEV